MFNKKKKTKKVKKLKKETLKKLEQRKFHHSCDKSSKLKVQISGFVRSGHVFYKVNAAFNKNKELIRTLIQF
jgi:hypothetical protein